MYGLLTSIIFKLDPETAHGIALKALKHGFVSGEKINDDPALRVTLWNRVFQNPIGLAAGFDKNAEVIAPVLNLGFGFVEVGTVTPKPQTGNPRPRIFRDVKNQAVINRMGFPNKGAGVFKNNLTHFLSRKPRSQGVVGVNIGMNKDQAEPSKDYMHLVRSLAPMADYITINISSPNTPGLRNLQEPEALSELLTDVLKERSSSCGSYPPPLLVKLAPDLTDAQMTAIATVLLSLKIDGVILTNTTLFRPDYLSQSFAGQKGGLSGQPLTDISTATIRKFYALTGGAIPIIGAGGVSSGLDAYAKIRAGASLVQLYSAFVFHGPKLICKINAELLELIRVDGFGHITEAIGADHR